MVNATVSLLSNNEFNNFFLSTFPKEFKALCNISLTVPFKLLERSLLILFMLNFRIGSITLYRFMIYCFAVDFLVFSHLFLFFNISFFIIFFLFLQVYFNFSSISTLPKQNCFIHFLR